MGYPCNQASAADQSTRPYLLYTPIHFEEYHRVLHVARSYPLPHGRSSKPVLHVQYYCNKLKQ